MQKTKPIHEIRYAAIRASIWENTSDKSTFFNVTLSRVYKNGEEWKRTESFGRDDLLLVAKVANQAHSWIFQNQNKNPATNS